MNSDFLNLLSTLIVVSCLGISYRAARQVEAQLRRIKRQQLILHLAEIRASAQQKAAVEPAVHLQPGGWWRWCAVEPVAVERPNRGV